MSNETANFDPSFGQWVRRRRQALDLTQAELARRAACSVALIRKVEADERRLSKESAELLAKALNVAPADQAAFVQAARSDLATRAAVTTHAASSTSEVATPLATPPATPPSATRTTNLPVVATPLLGRAAEVATLLDLIRRPACRLLTVVGVGGMGKTRLTLEMAGQALPLFADGVFFVALTPIRDGQLIVPAIAEAVGFALPSTGDQPLHLQQHLHNRHLLLVLDNAEHLLDDVATVVDSLLQTNAVKIVLTSRERLNVQREWIFDLQGLTVPPVGWAALAASQSLADYSAVQFFVACARRVQIDFALAPNAAAVARICRLVEGLPLGIELAAAWVHVLSCEEIAAEIAQTLDFLSSNRRDVPLRHRSIRATIDYSWTLLTATEQSVLRRLAVFRGGFTREAAQRVAEATLPRLTALFDKSLVQRVGDSRYDLHELVRQYAAMQLASAAQQFSAEEKDAARSHTLYYIELAETARRQWFSVEQANWAERLQQDLDNFRAAQSWIVTAGELTLAPRLANALWRFWEMRSYVAEGRRWITAVLAKCATQPEAEATQVRTQILHIAGLLARIQGDFTQAREYHLQSLALRKEGGDAVGMAAALIGLGNVAIFMGDYEAAEAYFAENLVIHRQRNDTHHIHITYNNLAIAAMYQGHYERAQQLHEEVLAYHHQHGAQDSIAGALGNLGDVLRCRGNYDDAMKVLLESLALFDQLQSLQGKMVTLNSLGRVTLALGQPEEATAYFAASLRLYTLAADKIAVLDNLEGMAQVATHERQLPRAVVLFAAATAQRIALSIPLPPMDRPQQATSIALLRATLSPNDFARAWEQGQTLALEEAITYALNTA